MKHIILLVLVAFAVSIGCEDTEPSAIQAPATSPPIAQVPPTVVPTATAVPTATSTPIADTATPTHTATLERTQTPTATATPEPTSTATATLTPVHPTATLVPTSTPTATRIPTNTPTPTPTPVPIGESRDNPAPIGPDGVLVTDDGFQIGVGTATRNIAEAEALTELVLSANQYNEPPTEGHLFVNVGIVVSNLSAESRTFDAGYRLRLVGQSNVAYSQFENSCGVLPDELGKFDSYREMFEGGTLSGFACFSVKTSDIGTLVLYDDGPVFGDSKRLFWALPTASEPAPTPTPRPVNTPGPTATSAPTSTPAPTATSTPIPIGRSPDNPFPLRDKGDLANLDGFSLRIVEVTQGRSADAMVQYADKISNDYSRVVIRIKVQNDGIRGDNYDARGRLQAYGLKDGREYKDWGRSDSDAYCGLGLDVEWKSYEDIDPDRSKTANVCFLVRKADVGALLLVDNGGYGGSYEDWRYWKLRK